MFFLSKSLPEQLIGCIIITPYRLNFLKKIQVVGSYSRIIALQDVHWAIAIAIDCNVTTRLVSQPLFGTGAYIVHPSPTQPGSQGLSSYAPGGGRGAVRLETLGTRLSPT